MNKILAFFAFLFLIGCINTQLTKEGSGVRLAFDNKPKGCKSLSSFKQSLAVKSLDEKDKVKLFHNVIRNEAADRGGNVVNVKSMTENLNSKGTWGLNYYEVKNYVYKCPK